jgi:nicotinate phosphoribosyltransferase
MQDAAASRGARGMLTDLYQLTMACAYWKAGIESTHACFHLYFRDNPFRGGFAVSAGLADAMAYLEDLRFSAEDTAYLATLQGRDGEPLFDPAFLTHLEDFRFTCDVHAMPEGTVFFPNEPILRVTAPIAEAQLVETRLINLLHLQTLIASKAARIVLAAPGKVLVDFGLRRAHGAEAGLLAARASYLAGFDGTATTIAEHELSLIHISEPTRPY